MQKGFQVQSEDKEFLTRLEKLSEKVWEKELFNSPFLLDLFEGKLPRKKFANYLIQDYHYLGRFAQAMAMATARAEDLFTMKMFGTHVKITLDLEFPRVWKLMTRFGIRKATLENSRPMPVTVTYTNFLFDTCAKCSSAEAIAAIHPCIFSYRYFGKKVRLALKKYYHIPDSYISFNLYQKRIFGDSGANTLEALARDASEVKEERILEKFYEATKFERQFWDQTY